MCVEVLLDPDGWGHEPTSLSVPSARDVKNRSDNCSADIRGRNCLFCGASTFFHRPFCDITTTQQQQYLGRFSSTPAKQLYFNLSPSPDMLRCRHSLHNFALRTIQSTTCNNFYHKMSLPRRARYDSNANPMSSSPRREETETKPPEVSKLQTLKNLKW